MRWLRRLMPPGALASVVVFVAATQPFASGCSSVAQAVPSTSQGALSYAQLEGVWIQAGGPAAVAPTAAAVAMAESGGKPIMQQGQPYATTGWSYWQTTPGDSTPQFGVDAQLFVPINSARSAVFKFTAAHGFSPWTTYTSGAYLAFMQGGTSPTAVSSSSGCLGVSGGGGNPAPGARWGRLDMGFDGNYDMTRGAVAPYAGTMHIPGITGWPGQGVYFYVVNADQTGPDYTRAMYFAEGAVPVVADGAPVTAGEQIGQPVQSGGNKSPGNFEIGPAQVGNGDCLAKQYGLGSAAAKQEVMAFYSWMQTLGAGMSTDVSAAGNK